MNRRGLWPIGSPYEITPMQFCGTCIQVVCGFYACSLTTGLQDTVHVPKRVPEGYCVGTIQVPVDLELP